MMLTRLSEKSRVNELVFILLNEQLKILSFKRLRLFTT